MTEEEQITVEKFIVLGGLGFEVEATIYAPYRVKYVVHEITGFSFDRQEIVQKELYLTATIKWDMCSHFTFGQEEKGNQDGYLHLCGYESFLKHTKLMKILYTHAQAHTVTSEFVDWDWQDVITFEGEPLI